MRKIKIRTILKIKICLYIIHDVCKRRRGRANHTCFAKSHRLFPLALGTGAEEKWNEHAQTRLFITSFSAKNFEVLRGTYFADILKARARKCPPLSDQPDHLPQAATDPERPSRLAQRWCGDQQMCGIQSLMGRLFGLLPSRLGNERISGVLRQAFG